MSLVDARELDRVAQDVAATATHWDRASWAFPSSDDRAAICKENAKAMRIAASDLRGIARDIREDHGIDV